MDVLQTVLLVIQVFVALSLIGFILIQHGKGADAGAAFGSGASSTVFGSQGSGNFLTKVTTVLAAAFLLNSLALGYLATQKEAPTSIMQNAEVLGQEAIKKDVPGILEEAAKEKERQDMPAAPATESVTSPASDVPELPAN
jgi:preprotein translocase subunit SecG